MPTITILLTPRHAAAMRSSALARRAVLLAELPPGRPGPPPLAGTAGPSAAEARAWREIRALGALILRLEAIAAEGGVVGEVPQRLTGPAPLLWAAAYETVCVASGSLHDACLSYWTGALVPDDIVDGIELVADRVGLLRGIERAGAL